VGTPSLILIFLLHVSLPALSGCGNGGGADYTGKDQPLKPLDEVLDGHASRLMKIDGVVGVYAGALPDGAPCLVIMLRDDGPEKRGELPGELEGYPVRLEVGGEIRPLKK